ncbi:MAG: PVC-type heme-binding CxxCH protein [Ferruginibacter sp.]
MNTINNNPGTFLFIVCALLCFGCSEKHYSEALSPDQEMKHFELDPGFKIEIFASEPNVLSPVDLVWDEEGNVYVIEMGDYPSIAEAGKAKGRIRVLKDTNHDGTIDEAIVFADNLPSATSMLPWKGGLIVTAAPDILYLKDTTGDFHADTREVLFTGFFAKNSEAQITSLRFGVDNWIYANNNAQDGEVSSTRNPGAPALRVGGSDFRFRLDSGLFENVTGWGQFGMTMDDWGHRFYTQNTFHIQQSPIRWKYLHRHNFLPSTNTDINISDHDLLMFQRTPPPYWRQERTIRRQKEFKELKLDNEEYAEKHFTGCSGGTIYLSDVFPKEYYGAVFTGDVSGNLVHRDSLIPGKENPAFIAKRSEKEKDREFLASTDPWTRPANFRVGPDGYLYMVDMYRQHIEAPVSIPEDLKAEMDYSNGQNYGRIYRILPKSIAKETTIAGLGSKTSAELVSLLADPNQWVRQQAHMLLIQRPDNAIIPLLKTMFETHADPRARIHSLFVLEGLNELNETMVSKALKDPEPGLREQAVILSERYPRLLPQLLEMVNDPSAQVVLQATLSLGEFSDTRVVQALAKVIEQRVAEPLFRTAVLSSNQGSGPGLLKVLTDRRIFLKDGNSQKSAFLRDLSYVTGARNNEEEILNLSALLSHPEIKSKDSILLACLEGLSRGFESAKIKNKYSGVILKALEKNLPEQNEGIRAAMKKIKLALGDTI